MIKLMFDTDMGSDCDDAGALALLHELATLGECEILSVTHCHKGKSLSPDYHTLLPVSRSPLLLL